MDIGHNIVNSVKCKSSLKFYVEKSRLIFFISFETNSQGCSYLSSSHISKPDFIYVFQTIFLDKFIDNSCYMKVTMISHNSLDFYY